MVSVEEKLALLVTDSTNEALKAERALKDAGIPVVVIPTPEEITAGCGIALLVRDRWLGEAKKAVGEAGCPGCRWSYPFERAGRPGAAPGGGDSLTEKIRLTDYSRRAG